LPFLTNFGTPHPFHNLIKHITKLPFKTSTTKELTEKESPRTAYK
jgi:hypothetical protein